MFRRTLTTLALTSMLASLTACTGTTTAMDIAIRQPQVTATARTDTNLPDHIVNGGFDYPDMSMLGARDSLPVESPDILHNGHRYRHVPFLPERRPAATGRIKTDWQLGNIQAAAPMPLTSPGNDDDTGENHQPTLRKNTAEPVEQTLKQNRTGTRMETPRKTSRKETAMKTSTPPPMV